jgi:O-antigen ligase
LYALAQRYGLGIGRTVAVAAGSNAVARVAATLGFLALAAITFRKDLKSILPIAAVICAIGIVYLTGSRGTLLTLPIMALVAGMFALPWLWQKSKWLTIASFITVLVAAAALVLWDPNGFVERAIFTVSELAQGRTDGNSSELRLQMLVGAWNAFWQSPLIGHGWAGHWNALVENHPTPDIFAQVKQYFSYHNDLADFAVAGGVIGILVYALLLFAPIYNLIIDPSLRQNKRAAYALVLLPVSFLFFGLTDFVFGFDLLTTLYGFSLAFVLAAARQQPNAIQQRFG